MRALPRGLMVLGLMGVAVLGICGGNEEAKKEIIAQERATREIAPPATSINKVVIGVLDFEATGGSSPGYSYLEPKRALMRDLKRNTRVKLVDIRESCSLSDLKRHGYERAERYKNSYQLDMILHTHVRNGFYRDWGFAFSIIDLYTKKVKEVSTEIREISVELGLRGISRKILVSQDLNRVLSAKKKVLAKKEVTVSQEGKESPKTATRETAPPAVSIDKVVIGVLDFETAWGAPGGRRSKNALMRELKRNTRVKLVDIRDSCSLSDLKRHGYLRGEWFKKIYQLDMILHVHMTGISPSATSGDIYFSLIDLYTKKIREISIEITRAIPVEPQFRGISRKILISRDLNRVLRAKKKVLAKKEVTVRPEVKEPPKREVKKSPQEIEGFLVQNGPTLIAENEYDRVLELIEDLPRKRRRHIQIQTLDCFANLKGWVRDRDQSCKSDWWKLRQKLINSGDNEATPMLVVFLKDEDPYLRIYAAELLEHIGDKRALQDLRAAGENDENRKVRKYAKRAYEQISGEKF